MTIHIREYALTRVGVGHFGEKPYLCSILKYCINMKVLMINGSPRQKGNTNVALTEIARTLESDGIESEIVWIGNKPVRGCIACGKCRELSGACAFNDDICNVIGAKFSEADALIVGSPVYYGQPNGALLAVLQRAFYSNSIAIAGKPAAVVAVCRRGGASAVFETLNMPFPVAFFLFIKAFFNCKFSRCLFCSLFCFSVARAVYLISKMNTDCKNLVVVRAAF